MLILPLFAHGQIPVDANGWSIFTPSTDSRIYYVDDVNGNDSTAQYVNATSLSDPFNPSISINAYKTLTAAVAAARNGYPDWILLRRGGVWNNQHLQAFKSGRSASEPMLLGYYGSSGPRPLLRISEHFINHDGATRNYQAFLGLEIYAPDLDPASPTFNGQLTHRSMRFVGAGKGIIIEDCKFRFLELVIQGYNGGTYENIKIRRSIILDVWYRESSYNNAIRPSGLYAAHVDGLLVEENLFDHNGWSADIPGAGANAYNHNVYIQYENTGCVIRGNIFSRASSHGIQLRSGGILDRNLALLNSIGMTAGSEIDPADVQDNVVLEGKRMDPTNASEPRTNAVFGLEIKNASAGLNHYAIDNIVAHRWQSGTNTAYGIDAESQANLQQSGNITYNWNSSEDMWNSNWLDPERSVASYHATIGMPADSLSFIEAARNRPLQQMPWNYTAYAVIDYIREGFNKSSITGPYNYSSSGPVHVSSVTVTPASLILNGLQTGYLSASVSPSNATLPAVTWTSSNPSVATVDRLGVVRSVAPGSATITATTWDGSYTDTTPITVTYVATSSVVLDEEELYAHLGTQARLNATVYPANASNPAVSWTSSNPAVAAVDQNGNLSFLSPGTAVITVTTIDGNKTATCYVTVSAMTNVVLGKPVTADSNHTASAGASAAVDGDSSPSDSSRWVSNSTAWPHWLDIDLQEPCTISELRFWTGGTGKYQNPIAFKLQAWTGSQWTDVLVRSSNSSPVVQETFAPVTTSRVRLLGTGGSDTIMRVFEVEVFGTVAHENIALGKSVTADSNHSASAGASAVVDGNNSPLDSTRWVSANSSWPHWLEIDLGGNFSISQLKFWTGSHNSYSHPIDFIFQVWNGSQWDDVVEVTGNPLSSVDETFTPVSGRFVRLLGTGGNDNLMRIFELEIYGN